jgi:hypothetical protein
MRIAGDLGRNLLALLNSMSNSNENLSEAGSRCSDVALPSQTDEKVLSPRVDFRHVSGHLSQKKPGFYLILLRNEIRHRSLKEKPGLIP